MRHGPRTVAVMDLASASSVVLLALVVPVAGCVLRRNAPGAKWGFVPAGEETRPVGPYRTVPIALTRRATPPAVVWAAAFTCYLLGQMVVTAPIALIGLPCIASYPGILVLLLSAPTGAVVAAKLLAIADGLVMNADGIAERARNAAAWAFGHNVVLLAALGVVSLAGVESLFRGPATAIYPCISLLQATLLVRAAAAIDAHNGRRITTSTLTPEVAA